MVMEPENGSFLHEFHEESVDNPDSMADVTPLEDVGANEEAGCDVTPTVPRRRTANDQPKKSTRKRLSNPGHWKKNVAKKALNFGQSHISASGKQRPERAIKPRCTNKCNRCQRQITDDERKSIHDGFWTIGDHVRQLDYLAKHITCTSPKEKFAEPGKKGKENIRTYRFSIKGREVKVCKTMFLNTLSINDSWIKSATSQTRDGAFAPKDDRGKHSKRPTATTNVVKDSVRTHINMVPRVESHYCRANTKREYVENGLSVEELHRRYEKWAKEEMKMEVTASLRAYRKIFNEEFNIGTFQPKKDQCATCSKWRHSTTNEKAQMARMYADHTRNRNISREMKESDKKEAKGDRTMCVASFDLQKVLTCPRSEVSTFYYVHKISVYNFTIFEMAPLVGTCYVWNETQAKRGSNEVASHLYHFIQKKKQQGVKTFVFYSDNPASQNKNRYVFGMYLLASSKFGVKITHKFLETGHTQMEVDSMHHTIEMAAKSREIYDLEEWYAVILGAKKQGETYLIERVGETCQVLDFKPLVNGQHWDKDADKNTIKWTKVRQVSVDAAGAPNTIFIKYEYEAEPITLVVKQKNGAPVNPGYMPSRAYPTLLPLPPNKAKDIAFLVKGRSIPTKYHPFYNRILDIQGQRAEEGCYQDCYCGECENGLDDDAVN